MNGQHRRFRYPPRGQKQKIKNRIPSGFDPHRGGASTLQSLVRAILRTSTALQTLTLYGLSVGAVSAHTEDLQFVYTISGKGSCFLLYHVLFYICLITETLG